MKISTFNILILIILLVNTTVHSQILSKDIIAKIQVEESENTLSVTGTAENLTDVYKNLYYKLTVFKKSKTAGNQSDNAQDGHFTLDPNQKKDLSKTQINISPEDQTILLLLIYDEDKNLLAKDRIEYGINQEKKNETPAYDKPNDGLMMMSIISDQTKTRIGKDFYDYFYTAYNKLKINTAKIISIEEELTFARTTKIAVKIDSDTISEFISKPDAEFLTYMAEDSAKKIFEYLKNVEKQSKQIMQY